MTLVARGVNGEVEVDGDWLTIRRSAAKSRSDRLAGDKRIPLAGITSVQFKGVTTWSSGFIQFTHEGGSEAAWEKTGWGVGLPRGASGDENTVIFNERQMMAEFEAVRDYVEQCILDRVQRQGQPVPAGDDTVSQLERLAALRERGVLTDEEFAAQKAKLLGG